MQTGQDSLSATPFRWLLVFHFPATPAWADMSDGVPINPSAELGAFPPPPCHAGGHTGMWLLSVRRSGLHRGPATERLRFPPPLIAITVTRGPFEKCQ